MACKNNNLGWLPSLALTTGKQFLDTIATVLVYLDPHRAHFIAHGSPLRHILGVDAIYNDPSQHGHAAANINQLKTQSIFGKHADALLLFLESPWFLQHWWASVCETVQFIHDNLQLEISTSLTPTRDPIAFTNIFGIAFGNPSNQFSGAQKDLLSGHLTAAALFEEICLDVIVVFKDHLG